MSVLLLRVLVRARAVLLARAEPAVLDSIALLGIPNQVVARMHVDLPLVKQMRLLEEIKVHRPGRLAALRTGRVDRNRSTLLDVLGNAQ